MAKIKDLSEQELLQLYIKKDDISYLGEVLQRYSLLLMGVCMKYLKHEIEAQDMVQQIFLKVINESGKYEISNFGGWLYRITVNCCLSELRKKKPNITTEEYIQDILTEQESDIKIIQLKEQRFNLLEEALHSLKPGQKECIQLFYIEQNSYHTIAEKLNLTLNDVKSHIQNGKRKLKIYIEQKEALNLPNNEPKS